MKILVTGAAGFIGYHLSKKLISENVSVIGLDNINSYYDPNLKYDRLKNLGILKSQIIDNQLIESNTYNNFNFYKINLEDKENLELVFINEKPDIIINLAAQAGVRYSLTNPDAYIQSNIVGFTNILELCKIYNIKDIIYASSSSVYGSNKKLPFSTEDRLTTLFHFMLQLKNLMNYSLTHTLIYLILEPLD